MQARKAGVALILAVLVGAASLAIAAGPVVTLSGKVSCAMCTLKKADAKDCQDVLVVAGARAGEYYLVKNAVVEQFGHTCKGSKAVRATGTVSEQDGKKWLTATKLEPLTS
jgi:uncharacterized membrane protein